MDERITCFIPDGSNCTGYKEGKVSATLCLGYHYGGGGDAALILKEEKKKPVICLQANGIDRCDTAECNGCGWSDGGVSYTLNTIDRHAVCFPVESFGHDERSTQFSRGGCCDTLTSSDHKQPIIIAYEKQQEVLVFKERAGCAGGAKGY